ncbi:unnamed protein product, partial [Cyprideis torosa]
MSSGDSKPQLRVAFPRGRVKVVGYSVSYNLQTRETSEKAPHQLQGIQLSNNYKFAIVCDRQNPTKDSIMIKAVLQLALVAMAVAQYKQPSYGQPSYGQPSYKEERYEPKDYKFAYAVKDDYSYVDFGHEEARNGYDTQGVYYVA